MAGLVANVLADVHPDTALSTAGCLGRFVLVPVVKVGFKPLTLAPNAYAKKPR